MSSSEETRLSDLREHCDRLRRSLDATLSLIDTAALATYREDFDKCTTALGLAEEALERPGSLQNPIAVHDLRNHFGVVKGYAELLAEETQDEGHACLADRLLEVQAITVGALQMLDSGAPVNRQQIDSTATQASAENWSPEGTLGRLLVIDDEDSSRQLLMRHLERAGHTVFGAASGQQALTILNEHAVDLIFLDLIMPEMTGLELLRRLKADPRFRATPVIIVSGLQDTEGVIRCIEAGAEDYLQKPFNPILLQARLRAGLQRKEWYDREQEYQRELERNQRFIRNTFGRYLSDEIVDALLESPQGLNLGGITTEVTVLMADIRNFTSICEQQAPERVVSLLNNYLGVMSEIIMNHHGTVDEFLGDAILAIFGAPINRPDDAARAIACAIEMQRAVSDINSRNEALALPAISIGIGLNTGTVVAGNIGSERRSKYGIVGHPVNLTARIESYTAGGEILASAATVDRSGAAVGTGRRFTEQPKGMAEEIEIVQVISIGPPYNESLE